MRNANQKKISAMFQKQRWDSRNRTIDTEAVKFDATNAVLNLTLDDIRQIEDSSESSDRIGLLSVNHDGPFYVYDLEDSILEFFDVNDVNYITEGMLEAAVKEHQPVKYKTVKLRITIDAEVSVLDNIETSSLKASSSGKFDFTLTSGLRGVSITNSRIASMEYEDAESISAPSMV